MSVIDCSIRAALFTTVWTCSHLNGNAQVMVLPPIAPIQVDVCGTVISDTGCVQLLQTDEGGLFSVDNWTDSTTGVVAQVGDAVRVIGENPFGLCWNGCQPGAACLFNVDVRIDCLLEVQPFCFGDAMPLACPCGNNSPVGSDAGCQNSTGQGSVLQALGSVMVAADDLVLVVDDAPANVPGMIVAGQSEVALPFKDGILCAGSPTVRVQPLIVDASGSGVSNPGLAARESLVPGDVRVYQYWFRDPQVGPCGNASNLTNALRVNWL